MGEREPLLHAEELADAEPEAALAVLAALAGPTGPLPPGLAWRLGMVHYLAGRLATATEILDRGAYPTENTGDEAQLAAWSATARWAVGDVPGCGDLAARALRIATAAGCERALAAAHVASALHAERLGDRGANQFHYRRALVHAERAGDRRQIARIRTNQASQALEVAAYATAREAAEVATAAAELAGTPAYLVVAVSNHAQALLRLGVLDEAVERFQIALTLCQNTGDAAAAYALNGLGEVYRRQGRPTLARTAHEEALRISESCADLQGIVPATAGLVLLLADSEPEVAAALAENAASRAVGRLLGVAELSTARVERSAGRPDQAMAAVTRAEGIARRHRDRAGLADALELRSALAADPAARHAALTEARSIWAEAGATGDADRMAVELAGLPGATDEERSEGRRARHRLVAAGLCEPGAEPIVIRTLGRFEVRAGGRGAPPVSWPSRKARDLLRILLARRGRPVPREELTELLWGASGPGDVGHRLSTELSGLRGQLDPDRTSGFLRVDRASAAVDPSRLWLDVDVFLTDAGRGLAAHERGDLAEAGRVLTEAERLYGGDFLADEPYDEWSVPLREEARSVYLRVLTVLAEISPPDEAIRYVHRSLAIDPYDERCHRFLLRLLRDSGRHGEARRALRRFEEAMREIGVG
ncbi:hypothetical protein Lfu02_09040 [Longispora fulva]|uniref:DNA-binding SARP family transcriptional activator n=1 Tax=Longispora fulva TaxID=619741 RepID=A0A8J7GFW4_9ACTN|nr:BTAD domain-containing putative transcriptional regulator [Longispora fulva]MBG6135233.1 DNA-binding SARP family transcriptional activator [Longispora fulva]GIG56532.1 hypothetical protein Lfu02_09040 [Longispora fulva]